MLPTDERILAIQEEQGEPIPQSVLLALSTREQDYPTRQFILDQYVDNNNMVLPMRSSHLIHQLETMDVGSITLLDDYDMTVSIIKIDDLIILRVVDNAPMYPTPVASPETTSESGMETDTEIDTEID